MGLPARDRVQHLLAGRAVVGKEGRTPLRHKLRLILHVLAAAGNEHQRGNCAQPEALSHAEAICV
jgi:hypothetical protein